MVGRGGAYGDIDGDGDLDVLLVPVGRRRPAAAQRPPAARWLRFELVGDASNRDAVGREVELTTGGGTSPAAGLADARLSVAVGADVTFGFAPGETPASLRVQWPSGAVQTPAGLALNQVTTITEVP